MSRPPLLPDAAILAFIDELRDQHAVLTGSRLRDELARRHGLRGGVTRIYRLLHQATQPQPVGAPATRLEPADDGAELQAQLAAALERARLAEHREEHHQTRWAGEIHALREQVRTHLDASHRLTILEGELQDRSRELASAFYRISDLENEIDRLRGS